MDDFQILMIVYCILVIYIVSLSFIFFFSLSQLHLVLYYQKALRKKKKEQVVPTLKVWPWVTVQLPVYNELYVVERLLEAVADFDYPTERLEVQVLDDSEDQTVEIIAEKVKALQEQGFNIQHIRRKERVGFKAGALNYGLDCCKGEFIAIFDADFLPEKDFLRKTIPHFTQDNIGVVQTRWGHVNKDYSLLTSLQAFGLDAHFTIEQGGRSAARSFINFNGTAGVWRKSCITSSGGWQYDTLTEDLDLSYRAQLCGWKFVYLEDVVAPAELPVLMPAIKSQQFRWNKGAAESARKNLGQVLKAHLGLSNKIHATFHLLNSSVFVFLLIAALLSIPILFVKQHYPEVQWVINLGGVFLLGFFSITYFYWVASKRLVPTKTTWYFLKHFPLFLMVSMGLSLHNAIAVLEGLLGFKSPFIRTPKFNITSVKDQWKGNIYVKPKLSILNVLEGLLGIYFLGGIVTGIYLKDLGFLLFHGMLALGFALVFYYSLKATLRRA
ncbi:cellulose synthase family protein [Rapidithrix thailandica]|uniref:Cellulose synthase family protein n=1 Tax=Rapidithrix thailandica TaxID=413964 RepID=A0AAW9S979_9BACT